MISVRLVSLAKYVKYNDKIIDIGCDHALLDIYLVKNNIVRNMIVSDIHENALQSGIENISKNNLSDKIDARLGNGLEVLNKKDKIDTILISGMGTKTILEILDNEHLNDVNKLIIQSNNDHNILRSEILKKGFKVKNEEYVIDNKKGYINIVFERGNQSLKKDELLYGPILIHNKTYLNNVKENYLNILEHIPKKKFILRFKMKRNIHKIDKLLKSY